MNNTNSSGHFLLIFKFMIVLLLAGGLYLELDVDFHDTKTLAHEDSYLQEVSMKPADIKQPAVTVKPLSDYGEVVERPLFSVFRQKYEPLETTPVTEPVVDNAKLIKLMGVSIVSGDKAALLWHEKQRKHHTLGKGQSLDHWVVEAIEERSVILSRGGSRVTLMVHQEKIDK